ncbi:Exonuclease SbcC [Streptomyces misionensis JCM 4497]
MGREPRRGAEGTGEGGAHRAPARTQPPHRPVNAAQHRVRRASEHPREAAPHVRPLPPRRVRVVFLRFILGPGDIPSFGAWPNEPRRNFPLVVLS